MISMYTNEEHQVQTVCFLRELIVLLDKANSLGFSREELTMYW